MPARRLPTALLLTTAMAVLLPGVVWTGAATAAGPATTTSAPPSSVPTTTSTTSPAPATVPPPGTPVDNLQVDAISAQFVADVQAEVGSAQAALGAAQGQLAKAQAVDNAASAALDAQTQRLYDLDAAERQQAIALQSARDRLRDLAIDAYVSGGPGAPIQQLLSTDNINDFARREGYFSAVANASQDAVAAYTRARDASTRAARSAADQMQRADAAKAVADDNLLSAQAAVTNATTVFTQREVLLTLAHDAASTPGTDIPRMVLDAYQRAALAVQAKGCHLEWWGLAGIGKVESDHGRDQSARLAANGDLVPHIVGVALSGQDGTALIQGPDGDFAHAEGPMQFIPSTWAKWGQDGNGDGVKDVDNVYDAALGAAMYLCATTTALDTDLGLLAAYYSYNHSTDYATEVLSYAKFYEAAGAAGLIPPLSPQPLYTLAPKTTPSSTTTPGSTSTTGSTSTPGSTATTGPTATTTTTAP